MNNPRKSKKLAKKSVKNSNTSTTTVEKINVEDENGDDSDEETVDPLEQKVKSILIKLEKK